ncbi:MAG: GIY-YIG nuclease family protein [Lachnospiraceae bacterium]|nr:GIY-YIG nuclease family protein [Lachnospiraceae bacterium]
MKKIYTIENNDMYLMGTGMEPDWTPNWEDALFYGSEREAKRDRDYFGFSLATIVQHEVILSSPPAIPSEARPVKKKKYHVYFVIERELAEGQTMPHLKVGYSHDPIKRLAQLQTGHPLKLGMEGWFTYDTEEEAQEIESAYHRLFGYYRTNGEWFQLSEIIWNVISDFPKEKGFTRYYC